jgi:hypothetical protein
MEIINTIYSVDILKFIYLFFNPSFIGGLFLVLGALLISEKGDFYYGSVMYILADLCWIYVSYQANEFNYATIFVIIGTLLGLRTFYKVHTNRFYQNLNTKEKL